jgi:hypothetical protein
MSGATFVLTSSTGQSDKLLYAMDFLKERINSLIMEKSPQITREDLLSLPNDKDPFSSKMYLNLNKSILPSLNEIEKSHQVFINGSYKPSVPITSEYAKVNYSNPKFGDSIIFQLPQMGHFTTDCVLHIRLTSMSAIDSRDRVRYVAMPGHKLIKNVQLLAHSGNVFDEYGTDDYNAYYQFEIPDNHKSGYLRNIGHDTPIQGKITFDPTADLFAEYRLVSDGNQTLKQTHNEVDLYIPLLFWFKDIKSALPSLPWGKLQIKVDFANVEDIVGYFDGGGGGKYNPPTMQFCDLYANQLFTLPEVFNIYAKKFVFNIIRTHRAHKQVITANGNGEYNIKLTNLKWPTEVLYVSFRPRENLSRSQDWFKSCKLVDKSYKVPVLAKDTSSLIIVSPAANPAPTSNTITITSSMSLSSVDNKYASFYLLLTSGRGYDKNIENNRYVVKSYNGTTKLLTIEGNWYGVYPDTTTVFELYTLQLASNKVTYEVEEPVITKLGLDANGIEIFKLSHEMFYNSYLPTKFINGNTPEEAYIYMLPFCTKLYGHSPSGSINMSLCKEIYIKFLSTIISKDYPVDLICLTRSINFVLVDSASGGISLRYSI